MTIDQVILFCAAIGIIAIAVAAIAAVVSSEGDRSTYEFTVPETPEYYEDEAAHVRAMKRKLDAEIELTESYIKAERARAELDELSEILAHDKAKRAR